MESGSTPYLHLTKNGTLIAINGKRKEMIEYFLTLLTRLTDVI